MDQVITRAAKHMQSVVITGASTGIGHACAKLLLDKGYHVFGSVRKQADADRLKTEFGGNFTPLLFDVTDEAAVLAAARDVRAALKARRSQASSTMPASQWPVPCSSFRPINSAASWTSTSSVRSSQRRPSGPCSAPTGP